MRSVLLCVAAILALSLATTSPPRSSAARHVANVQDDMPINVASTTRQSDVSLGAPGARGDTRVAPDPEWVFFDTPGDGAIWAGSEAYKTRFDATGVMYIPFLGPNAPRNYPLRFTVDAASVGDQPVPFTRNVSPVRAGDAIVFDRGVFIERYEIGPSSMEQLFVIAQLPGRGDLTLRINIDTELLATESLDRLEFTNERGAVRYSKAKVYDANRALAAAPTVLADGAIEISVPGDFLDRAALPITIDPVIDTWTVEGYEEYSGRPSVAFVESENRFHVVWERNYSDVDGDIYSELYDGNGVAIGGSRQVIDNSTANWRLPRTAANNIEHQFLVVAEVGPVGSRVIKGRMRAAFSNVTGAQFQISLPWLTDVAHPDVGGDPNTVGPTSYCVVYENLHAHDDHNILAHLVDPSEVVGPLIHVDSSADTYDSRPSISKCNGAPPKATQEWTVVWQRDSNTVDENIYGAQIHWDGSITTPSFLIDGSPELTERPVVSSLLDGGLAPRPYMVAYERGAPGDRHLEGVVLYGDTEITRQNLTAMQGVSGLEHVYAAVDSCGTSFTVVYSEEVWALDYDLFAATFCMHGSSLVLGEGYQTVSNSLRGDFEADLVAAHSGGAASDRFMIAWESRDGSAAFGDIEGGLYDVETSCPLNDNCDHAFDVLSGEIVSGNLTNATSDGASPCSGNSNPDVWYRFTAPSDGLLIASTCDTNDLPGIDQGMDTVVSVHSGCPGDSMNTLECDDDEGPPDCGDLDIGARLDSVVAVHLTYGQTVLIRVTHYADDIADGAFRLRVAFQSNDWCAFASPVDADDHHVGTLALATNDGESPCGGGMQATNPDVWYTFTAPSDGLLAVNTCGTHDAPGVDEGMDTVVSVHTGCPGDAENAVSCSDNATPPGCGPLDDGFAGDSSVRTCMTAGETVWIRVTHFGGAGGDGLFELDVKYGCPGDTDFDGVVDVDDLLTVIFNWGCDAGPDACLGDSNCDGTVGVDDLIDGVILNWGACEP
ncbi:MAG: hypothetical protein ACYTGC_06115 [Planctomycetota bacterium]|jgi:hypothetical protein